MLIVDMDSVLVAYKKNGLYFTHANLSEVNVTIKFSSVYHIHSNFPHHVSQLFYATLKCLGLETNKNLFLSAFAAARTICAFDFVTEDVDNGIPLDKTGNMDMQLTFNQGQKRNLVIIFFATPQG